MTLIPLSDYSDAYGLSLGDAISEAAHVGFTLNTHSDPEQDGQLDAAEWYAAEVAAADPSLVYLTGAGELSAISEERWERVCGAQCRAQFAAMAIDNGQTIAAAWAEAEAHAGGLA